MNMYVFVCLNRRPSPHHHQHNNFGSRLSHLTTVADAKEGKLTVSDMTDECRISAAVVYKGGKLTISGMTNGQIQALAELLSSITGASGSGCQAAASASFELHGESYSAS